MEFKDALTNFDKICNYKFEDKIKYVYLGNDGVYLYNENNININPTMEMIMDDNWVEYDNTSLKITCFDFYKKERYQTCKDYVICDYGFENDSFDNARVRYFDIFKTKEQAEYIKEKQLLDRKLETYAMLHNTDDKERFIISAYYDETYEIYYDELSGDKLHYETYFTTKEIAQSAIYLYEEDIKKVLKLKEGLKYGK